ncbi:hypothetical protein COI_1426 [Mannheimia haemolytica serotype A2 str. OVINE]|nr:hypothetical protein MHH_c07810 [Mannheimia haemolytica M42548]EEY10020.1 hypothetical protein COI_1426 [Mannheimia haemolytica serotype A2 str. OVINE]EEY12738.1 hypothetical protein COK_1149 [Mannheimia haemolytica serotype A2 str. BOVINE]
MRNHRFFIGFHLTSGHFYSNFCKKATCFDRLHLSLPKNVIYVTNLKQSIWFGKF